MNLITRLLNAILASLAFFCISIQADQELQKNLAKEKIEKSELKQINKELGLDVDEDVYDEEDEQATVNEKKNEIKAFIKKDYQVNNKDSNLKKEKEEIKKKEDNKEDKTDKEKKRKEDSKDKKKLDKDAKKCWLTYPVGDSEFKFWIKLRMPEFFYGKNLRFLNNDNPTDQVLYFRHTIDFNSEYRYGNSSRGCEVALAKLTIRNKGVWGDPESIGFTTESEIKELDVVFGAHKHAIPRHFLWIRELWLQLSLSDLLCIPFCNYHTLTVGAFPFELGRGIALGSAYATDPTDLGFLYEAAIDQYAFGMKLTGDVVVDKLVYDVYGAILQNKATTFDLTNARIRGQEFGHRNDQARGFGSINYLIAARLRWNYVNDKNSKSKLRIEPYGLFNRNPEQKVEFIADAKSDLITLGLAAEWELDKFEFGFDMARNFGHQSVFGWDRNVINKENRKGTVVIVNSKVRQAPPGQTPSATESPLALKVSENQAIINQSVQNASQNGKVIGTDSLGTLVNDEHRFSNPYTNLFRGQMFVFDMSYYFIKPDFKVSAGFGYASGGESPNRELDNDQTEPIEVYDGFIGLQESYSGTRIRSAFLLSGSGRIPRLLSFPEEDVFDPFPISLSRFTDLLFTGVGFTWKPCWSCRKWNLNPNIIAYWQDIPTRFFSEAIRLRIGRNEARKYLGLEINTFFEAELLEDLRYYCVGAVFLPGTHFRDIKGLPLTRSQLNFVENLDKTGIINDRQPLVGKDISFFLNMGLEYKF